MRVLIAALIVSGCAPRVPAWAGPGAAAARCETGTVGAAGLDPFPETVLQVEGGRALALTGEPVARLTRLTGAVVTVCGSAAPGGGLSVQSWELREVGGMPAYFGRVERAGGETFLDPGSGRPPIPLTEAPDQLRRSAGRESWVAGFWRDGAFSVLSFAVLSGP